MKPTRLLPLLVGSLAALSTATHAATKIWDGGASGTGTDLATAANWNADTLPVANDTLQWNGTAAGNLVLSVPNVTTFQGGTVGYVIDVTALQTGSLLVDNASLAATNSFRLASISIASGAGAFTLGDGAGTAILTLGGSGSTANTFTNNSANAATLASDLIWGDGNAQANRALTLTGSGNWNMNCVYGVTVAGGNGTLALTKTGTGTLFMNAANATYTGNTTISTGGGAGIIRATANQALGTGTVVFDTTGNASTARLELTGGISLNNPVTFSGRTNVSVAIQNISGNNTLSGALTISTGGGTYLIQSDAGTLTLSAATSLTGGTTTNGRTVTLQGAGNGVIVGNIINGTATVGITKNGTGIWTLNGANTYTGPTNITAGTLALSTNAQSVGSSAVTVADGASLGVAITSSGSTYTIPSLTLGTTTGSTLQINTGATGNPATAPLTATSLTANGPTTLKLTGSALAAGPSFPVVNYTTGTGIGNISLVLPPRTVGSLTDNPGVSLNVTITSLEQIKWDGANGTTWDADTVGDGSTGTANWRTTVTDAVTRYLQTATGSDTVNFTDSASGTGPVSVSLATTLTPIGVSVNNPTRPYTLTGSGKLSGSMALTKVGAASLTLANTTAYDHTGGTTISEGSLLLGDGITSGAGLISGTITNNATLVLNRPEDHAFALTLVGTGTLQKDQANTVSFNSTAQVTNTPLNINAGKLSFAGGGTLSGAISGPGQIEFASGTMLVNGSVANTNSGLTTVTAGQLQLNKTAGVNAVGGDITITGASQISLLAGEQVPDSATITVLGTNTDSVLTSAAVETVANVVVNSSTTGAGGAQIIMRNGFTVTGTGTLNSGVLGVGSGHTGTLNAVNITCAPGSNGILRIAGNTGASTMNIGSGGINASGGEIQVKFNANAFASTVNLGGDFNATGNVLFSNGGATAASNLSIINLVGDRTFTIGAGTTTTVGPNVGGTGGLTKVGDGTLVFNGISSYPGSTNISAGTLVVNGAIGNVAANGATAVLAGNTAAIGDVTATTGATVSPGQAGVGRLILNNLTLGSTGKVLIEASAPTTRHDGATGTYDALNVTGNLVLDGTFTLAAISGYTPVLGDSLDLWDAATVNATGFNTATDLVLPALGSGLAWDTSAFATTGVVTVVNGNPYTSWQNTKFTAPELANPLISGDNADPDRDGLSNALEYAFGTEPKTGNTGAYLPQSSVTAGALNLSYRRPVNGVSGVTYTIQVNSVDLVTGGANWTTANSPADYTQNATPNGDGTETVTINFAGTVSGKKFARVFVSF